MGEELDRLGISEYVRFLQIFGDALNGIVAWHRENAIEAQEWPNSPLRFHLAALEGRVKAAEAARGRIRVLEDIAAAAPEKLDDELAGERQKLRDAARETAARALIAYALVLRG